MTYAEKKEYVASFDNDKEWPTPLQADWLQHELQKAWAALEHIQGMCGSPDATQACRNIIKRANEALER